MLGTMRGIPGVTRIINSQKVAQKVAKVVLLKNSHFLNSPKGCKILGPLLYENTFPKPFKNCPIRSHCVIPTTNYFLFEAIWLIWCENVFSIAREKI